MATPPPVHSSSVIIGPDVDLSTLPWYQFYERRSLGRALGLGLIAGGASTFAMLSKPWTWFSTAVVPTSASNKKASLVWIPMSLSVVALITGIRLRIRKYYKDPEAVREYIHLFHNSSFSTAFKELDSWDGLLRSTSLVELTKTPFFARATNEALFLTSGIRFSIRFTYLVATPTMVKAKIERELQGYVPGAQVGKLTFDDVWQLYNEVSGHPTLLKEMIQREVIDVATLRALVLEDLEHSLANRPEKVLGTTGSTNPSAPPMDDDGVPESFVVHVESVTKNTGGSTNTDIGGSSITTRNFRRWPGLSDTGGPRHLIYRLRTYGSFLQAYLGIPQQVLQAALRNDAEVLSMTFSQLMGAQVRDLLSGPSALFSGELVRYKAIEYLNIQSPKFDTFINSFGNWLIDDGIIPASDFTHIFRRDVIEALDATTILDQWYEWPIKIYGHSLGLSTAALQLLMALNKQYQIAKNSFETEDKRLTKQYKAEVARLETRKQQVLSAASTPSSSTPNANTSNSNGQVPIVHVNKNGSVKVTGAEPSTATTPAVPATDRIEAQFGVEEMQLQDQLDVDSTKNKKSYEEIISAINEAWRNFLHPELAKPTSSNTNNTVQLNLNFSLFGGGLNVSPSN